MSRASLLINIFNGGEISPKLDARSDLQKYLSSCIKMENFIPLVEGGVQCRPGLYYVAEIKDSSKKGRLFPFQYSTTKSYIVLAEEGYFRYFADDAQIVSAPATPYEVANTYTEDELPEIKITQSADVLYMAHRSHCIKKMTRTSDTSWTFTDFVAVKADEIHITNATAANPCVITAVGDIDNFPLNGESVYISGVSGMTEINGIVFTVARDELIVATEDRDFSAASNWTNVDINSYDETDDLSLTADGAGQSCTLDAAFFPTTPGLHYQLSFTVSNLVDEWYIMNQDESATFETISTSGDHTIVFTAQTVGGIAIVSKSATSSGDFDDFSLYCLSSFQLDGIDSSAYIAYTSGGTAQTCQFGSTDNNPGAIAFFEQRFMAGGTNNDPLDVWGSCSADFENFKQDAEDDSSAIQYSLLSDKVDAINWLLGEEYLMIGTQGGIWRLGASSSTNPLSATNVVAKRQLTYGVKDMDAEMVADSILFVQRGGTTVRKVTWKWEQDKYTAMDVTRIARHITKGASAADSGITDMDYQSEPMSILWSVRADGQLLGMVYEPDENVYAWFRVITDGEFESVAVITGEDEEDQVWVIVKRTIDGDTKRYVEYFKPHELFNVYEDAFFVDSGLTWDGGAAITITDITRANPAVVTAASHGFTNGYKVRIKDVVGMTEVNQGLTTAYTVANKTDDTFELSDIDSSGWSQYKGGGTAQRVSNSLTGYSHLAKKTVAILTNYGKHPDVVVSAAGGISLNFYANVVHAGLPYEYNLQPMKIEPGMREGSSRGKIKKIYALSVAFYQSAGVKWGPDADTLTDVPFGLGSSPALYTGDIETDFDGDYETGATVYIQGASPLPCTILSVAPRTEVPSG